MAQMHKNTKTLRRKKANKLLENFNFGNRIEVGFRFRRSNIQKLVN